MDMFWRIIEAIAPSLIVGIVMALFNRKQRKHDKKADEQEAHRNEAEMVQVSLLLATAKLSYALAMAAKRGTPNGEVEDGIDQYKDALKSFKQFERKLVVRNTK